MPQLRGRPHPSILLSPKRKRVKRNPLGTQGIESITLWINLYRQGIKQLFFLILKLILYIRWEVIYPVDCYPPFEQLKDQIRWSLRTLTYFRSSLPSTRCLFEFWASRPFKLAKFHGNQRESMKHTCQLGHPWINHPSIFLKYFHIFYKLYSANSVILFDYY